MEAKWTKETPKEPGIYAVFWKDNAEREEIKIRYDLTTGISGIELAVKDGVLSYRSLQWLEGRWLPFQKEHAYLYLTPDARFIKLPSFNEVA